MKKEFISEIWKEDNIPKDGIKYKKCEVCSERSRIIWGEGNPEAPIVIILDNPGEREDKEGREYVCGTRETLQKSLYHVGIRPDNIYLTYLLKCRPLGSYNKERAREFSKPFLENQIKRINPKFLLCLGDVVVQSMFSDKDAHVKNLRGKWHSVIGYPTIVSYHPLAVRRRPNLKGVFIEDLEMLSKGLSNKM